MSGPSIGSGNDSRARPKRPVSIDDLHATFELADEEACWFWSRYAEGELHEPRVTQLILTLLRRTQVDLMVDVGAYFGWYSCLAALATKPSVVVAVDMDADNCRATKNNLLANRCESVEIIHSAVSDKCGLSYYKKPPGTRRLTLRLAAGDLARGPDCVEVPTITLDDWWPNSSRSGLVKVDVEGAETRVLRGMRDVLATIKPIVFVEYHRRESHEYGDTAQKLASLLYEHDYRLWVIPRMRQVEWGGPVYEVEHVGSFRGNEMLVACARDQPQTHVEIQSA